MLPPLFRSNHWHEDEVTCMTRTAFSVLSVPLALLLAACGGGSKDADTTAASSGTGAGDELPAGETPVAEDSATGDEGGADASGGASAADQVAKGGEVWGEACGICHGNTGKGKGKKNPAVVGDGSLAKYQTAADLYAYIKEKMPKDDPGSLSEDDAWAVTAWIASQNGKLGAAALSASSAGSIALH
jgi:cytochrome c